MRTVIFAVSNRGCRSAQRVAEAIRNGQDRKEDPVTIYIKSKYVTSCVTAYDTCSLHILDDNEDISEYAHLAFTEADALIFVCAAGIAVRMIAPCIDHKTRDPAVLVFDEALSFCIPILSGHAGGANMLAERLSNSLSCLPVITTASDVCGLKAVDTFAIDRGLHISDFTRAGELTAALVNGGSIGVINEAADVFKSRELPKGYSYVNQNNIISSKNDFDGLIRIAYEKGESCEEDVLTLIPVCLRVGIGCRKGTDADSIINAIKACFEDHGLYTQAIESIYSIELKKDEEGLNRACDRMGLSLVTYGAEELAGLEGSFSASDFVRDVTGVDNVCERSAVFGGGVLVVKKECRGGVTVAVAKDLNV